MRLGQRELSVIQPVLQLKSKVVKLNKTWQKLHSEMQLGQIIKGELHLTSDELGVLRVLYGKHVKTEPEVEYKVHVDRISLADHRIDEKSGSKTVFGEQLWFGSMGEKLPLKTGNMDIAHDGVTTAVSIDHLAIEKIRKLIIVENGAMLVMLHKWSQQIPNAWQNCLILYRGHSNNINYVNELLKTLPIDCMVAVYTDFDLYGLNISNQFNMIRPVSIMVPECWQSLHETHYDNNLRKFYEQVEYGNTLLSGEDTPSTIKVMVSHIKKNKLAVMQENVNRLGRLTCIALTD